jgi:toxin YoeB
MEITYTPEAEKDLLFWKKSGNKAIQKKITNLLDVISVTPTTGIAKPEQLKHELSGYWSRRINDEHRIVYKILDDKIEVLSLRFHYL